MGTMSKMWGALVGGLIGFGVSYLGLPEEWASPEVQAAVTTIVAMIAVYIFPANASS